MAKKYFFIDDGRHGWLRVPRQELEELGILNKISPASYQHGEFVYLEEDMDLTTYADAIGVGVAVTGDSGSYMRWEKENATRCNEPVRNYASFKPAPNMEWVDLPPVHGPNTVPMDESGEKWFWRPVTMAVSYSKEEAL